MMICRLYVVVMTVLIQLKYFLCFRFLLIRPAMQVCSFPLRVKKGWLMIYQTHICLHMHQAKSFAQTLECFHYCADDKISTHPDSFIHMWIERSRFAWQQRIVLYIKVIKIEAQITDNKISTFSRQFYTPRLKVRL